jgi:PPOX class probable F420-dependent enzyme
MARSPVDATVDAAEARRRFAEAPVGHLATVGSDLRPHVVPFCFALEAGTLWSAIDHKPKTTTRLQRLDDISDHPDVTVLVDSYSDDWSKLWWVMARGRARIIDDHLHGRALLMEKYDQYRDRPPGGPFIQIDLDEWRWWASSAS